MKRLSVAFALFVFASVPIFACDPQLDNARLELITRGFWRGIELGPGRYARAHADFALCGPRVAEKGPHGLEISLDAAVPIGDDGLDMASASIQYLRFFPKSQKSEDFRLDSIAAGYRQYHWGDATEDWSGEVFAEVRWEGNKDDLGWTYSPYVEIAHDFRLFEATFTRVGVQNIVGFTRLAITLDGSISGSDYVDDSFAFHAAEISTWLDWTVRPQSTFEVGVGGGYIRADDSLGDDGAWIGVRAKIR